MLYSKLFGKTTRDISKDEVSKNAQLLTRGGYIDRLQAGVYTLLPLGWRVVDKIESIIREEMNAIDGQEIFMPALCPRENYEKTGRYEILADDILFSAESKHVKNMVLNQSHEEVVSPLVKKFVKSYKDLPLAVYQIQTKFRGEARPKSGILRGREFRMKDLYSFHTDQSDLDAYYERAADAYKKVYERVGLGDVTYMTFASGGTFSKFSHEFQTLTDAGEDIIYICDKCGIGHNREVFDDNLVEKGTCVQCGNKNLREEKAVEVGNIFKLGNKFSAPFELQYTDQNGERHDAIMGCYGIGPTRVFGTIVEVHHDDDGIIWPESVAPFDVHMVVIGNHLERALELERELQKQGKDVLVDDRDVGAGVKFADADLLGIPLRITISDKTLAQNSVEVKKRNKPDANLMKIEEFLGR